MKETQRLYISFEDLKKLMNDIQENEVVSDALDVVGEAGLVLSIIRSPSTNELIWKVLH